MYVNKKTIKRLNSIKDMMSYACMIYVNYSHFS